MADGRRAATARGLERGHQFDLGHFDGMRDAREAIQVVRSEHLHFHLDPDVTDAYADGYAKGVHDILGDEAGLVIRTVVRP